MRRVVWALSGLVIWSVAVGLVAAPRTVPAGVVAAVLGCIAGAVAAWRLARTRVRLPVLWLGAAAAFGVARLLAWLLVASGPPAALLGARTAFVLAETIGWLGGALALVTVLQTSSRRVPGFLALELATVGAVFGSVVAAHRDGLISRPHTLIDAVWGRGYDPLPFFLGLGAVAAALLALLAIHRRSRRRSLLDGALVVGLVLLAFLLVPVGVVKLLEPPQGGGGQRQGDRGSGAGRGNRGDTDGVLSSFGDQQQPSENGPVAVVLLHDDYDPPSGYYYFRQTAFSQFNGQRLVQATGQEADRDLPAGFPTAPTRLPVRAALSDRFHRLDTTVAMLQPHPRPFALVNPTELGPAPNPDPVRFVRAYQVTSEVQVKELPELGEVRVGDPGWSRELQRHYTEGPDDPRYGDLAATCVELLRPELRTDPFAQAVAIQYWMSRNTTYSRNSGHEAAADPLVDFLFGDRVGHCVYLSHAACLLFRTRGIPSRVAAGYAVDGRSRGNGSALLIRGREAHAWPEVYLQGIGWWPMDIAPEKSLDPPDEGPDQGLQQMLGDMARQGAGRLPMEAEPAGGGNLQEALRAAVRAAVQGLAVLAVLALLGLYACKLWRRAAPRFCRPGRLPVAAYRAALDRLADHGLVRAFGQTREAFAGGPVGFSEAFARLTRLHLAARLGRSPAPLARHEFVRLGRQVAADVANRNAAWRRLLGTIDPLSWLWVK